MPNEKDPAFLFYTNDFLSGTYTMRDDQVGKYIRLLCLQHQKGKLTEKDMINICKTHDEDVYSKFVQENGYFINKRLELESTKRRSYAESRRQNRIGKKQSYVPHMENVNENGINSRVKGVKFNEEKTKVFFEDGSSQKLGVGQLRRIVFNDIQPEEIEKGYIV